MGIFGIKRELEEHRREARDWVKEEKLKEQKKQNKLLREILKELKNKKVV